MTAVLALSSASPARADEKQQTLEQQKQQAQQELEAAKDDLAQTQKEKEAAEAQKTQLQNQINTIVANIQTISAQIEETQKKIDEKQSEIEQKQTEVNAKQTDIDARWGAFKERMTAMQEMNDGGSIALLSSATNLNELLTFSQTLEDIANKDQQVVDQMEQEYAALNTEKQDLENAKTELESAKSSLEDQNNQLSGKKQEFVTSVQQQDSTISQADAEAEAQQLVIDQKQADFDKAADELDSYLRSLIVATQNKYSDAPISCSLNFICPLDSYKYISCQYGAGGHKGVDFAAPGGNPIHAVASGVVTVAGWHYSYGNYVMVYHGTDDSGNTYATLYAHMVSAPSVSEGQTVSQGDVLGYVGSTGNSTGNHLHLEMRVNGARTNPLNYVPH